MAAFKCKMCGGNLEIQEGTTVCECEYCGTKQTLPKTDNEQSLNLINRANHFRQQCEFDKAMEIYERLLNNNDSDAEIYWSIVLCRYGIEYVDDPVTKKKIATCHRTQYKSILDDPDYLEALAHADVLQKSLYQSEAEYIDNVQKSILEISNKEEPFDVFICYKESDDSGKRTPDSVLAQELYYQLVNEGFKVFFSRITLEDKLGTEYEPYIFAALNSSKVMVVVGTKPEYFNAVWVKNEWSRYLMLMQEDKSRTLIPAYKDMDPYDLPDALSMFQAQDMGKLGFMQDLIRGIKKITQAETPKATVVKETVITGGNANTASLLKRAFMFLEDGNWSSANEYCEKVLDMDPENAQAYLGNLMAELHVKKQDNLKDQAEPFDKSNNYQKVIRFADEKLKTTLLGYIEHIRTRNENARLVGIYNRAKNTMSAANTESAYKKAAHFFESISEYQDSASLAKECYEKAEVARKDAILAEGKTKMNGEVISNYESAIKLFESISGWKDADEKVYDCQKKIEEIKANDEAARKDGILAKGKAKMTGEDISNYESAIKFFESISGWKDADEKIYDCQKKIEEIKANDENKRLEKEHREEMIRKEVEKKVKRKKRIAIITPPIVCAIIAFIIVLNTVIIPNAKYNDAIALMDAGNFLEAYETFVGLDGYKDSSDKANSIYDKYKVEKIKVAKVGDYVLFGEYEQDNNTSNGKEEVEWLVLDIKDGKALVISKYSLDCKPYNEKQEEVTWETCTLRKWLNNNFLSAAFSTDEKAMIPTVTVPADKNPKYDTNPGNTTQDQVFLLSISEANKYFDSDRTRRCEPTNYAFEGGAHDSLSDYGDDWFWWLRSPGSWSFESCATALVFLDGHINESGSSVEDGFVAVRPALWIDLNS